MSESEFTVIIPAIKNAPILKYTIENCLKLINLDKIIIVTEDKENKFFEENLKVKYLIVENGTFMSVKRNKAVKLTSSKYLAFFDSDSYPANTETVKSAITILKENTKIYAIGGPDISPPNQNFWNQIIGLSTKSFLISGLRNWRKNILPEMYVPELSSSNLVMERAKYLEFKGMNENLYISEDTDLFNRIINRGYKLFYSPKVLAYHRDRTFKLFLIQRYVRGAQTSIAIKDYVKRLIKREKIQEGEFRYEYILTPSIFIYTFFFLVFIMFNKELNIFIISPYILIFLIFLFESVRLVKSLIKIPCVYLVITLATFIQSFSSVAIFIKPDLGLTKIYRNDNDK